MGPSTPRCSSSKLFGFCIVFVVADQVLFWVSYTACSLGIYWYGYFSPSRLGPCLPRCGALHSFLSPSLSLFLFVLFGCLFFEVLLVRVNRLERESARFYGEHTLGSSHPPPDE